MGCQCQKDDERKEELESNEKQYYDDQINDKDNYLLSSISKSKILTIDPKGVPKDEFSKYIFALINSLRVNPQSYIDIILKAKKNVIVDDYGNIIYKSSVKVALNTGEKAFDAAIDILKNTEPMNMLVYNPYLTVELPNNENEIKSKSYLQDQIKKKILEGIEIKSFWKDIINEPDTCFILTVVDDSGKCVGNKRNDILDKSNKFMGISSISIGRSFACYIVLS